MCAAAVSGLDSNAFFTGAMDGVVRVFDVRARQPVGSLLTSNMQPAAAHTGGQGLRLESNGHLLMTGGGAHAARAAAPGRWGAGRRPFLATVGHLAPCLRRT